LILTHAQIVAGSKAVLQKFLRVVVLSFYGPFTPSL
jgi:hypothetical protein